MEAETGVMLPQTEESQDLPDDGRGKEGFYSKALEGAQPCPHLDVGLLASRSVREQISVILSYLVSGTLV